MLHLAIAELETRLDSVSALSPRSQLSGRDHSTVPHLTAVEKILSDSNDPHPGEEAVHSSEQVPSDTPLDEFELEIQNILASVM